MRGTYIAPNSAYFKKGEQVTVLPHSTNNTQYHVYANTDCTGWVCNVQRSKVRLHTNQCIFEKRVCQYANNNCGEFTCEAPSDNEMPCKKIANEYYIVIESGEVKKLITTATITEEYLGDHKGFEDHEWAVGIVYTRDELMNRD